MMNNLEIRCKLHWVPPFENGKDKFHPNKEFRTNCKFTSDFLPNYTVVVNCSDEGNETFFNAILNIPFAESDELLRLITRSDLVVMDAYKVIAICKKLEVLE